MCGGGGGGGEGGGLGINHERMCVHFRFQMNKMNETVSFKMGVKFDSLLYMGISFFLYTCIIILYELRREDILN